MAPTALPRLLHTVALFGSLAHAVPTGARGRPGLVGIRDAGIPEPPINIVPQSRGWSWFLFVLLLALFIGIFVFLINSLHIPSWLRKKFRREPSV